MGVTYKCDSCKKSAQAAQVGDTRIFAMPPMWLSVAIEGARHVVCSDKCAQILGEKLGFGSLDIHRSGKWKLGIEQGLDLYKEEQDKKKKEQGASNDKAD
ncbi:MAG: hypothetical protein V3U60_16095 [Gammaproteobacteria bacterium]